MARQAWDEARHAQACVTRLAEAGGAIGEEPVDLRLWRMTTGQPAALRLAIHQRLGESVGVDAAIFSGDDFRRRGDSVTAELFEYVARDEITHVGFGNKWIRRLTESEAAVQDIHERADRIRRSFGDAVNGLQPFPFNRWAHERAGFNAAEIAHLYEARRGKAESKKENGHDRSYDAARER
jgi:uncharacterized ferritin-like protein (DUF455 family)